MKTVFRCLLVGCLLVLTLSGVSGISTTAVADDFTWTGGGDVNWNTPGNWLGGTVPDGNDYIIFDANSTANLVNTNNRGSGTLTGMKIRVTDPSGDIVINGDTIGLSSGASVDMSAATRDVILNLNQTLAYGACFYSVASGRTLTINGSIIAALALNKSGGGTLLLEGS